MRGRRRERLCSRFSRGQARGWGKCYRGARRLRGGFRGRGCLGCARLWACHAICWQIDRPGGIAAPACKEHNKYEQSPTNSPLHSPATGSGHQFAYFTRYGRSFQQENASAIIHQVDFSVFVLPKGGNIGSGLKHQRILPAPIRQVEQSPHLA